MLPAVVVTALLLGVLSGTPGLIPPADASPGGLEHDRFSTGQFEPGVQPTADTPNTSNDSAQIVDLYPNPPTFGDPDEFVTIAFPPDATPADYHLADEHDTVPLAPGRTNTTAANVSDTTPIGDPDTAPDRTVTFSNDVGLTASLTDRAVAPLSDRIRLADAGETISLVRNGTVVDSTTYGRAPEGNVYDATREVWRPLEATERPVERAGEGTVEAFVLPDEPDRAVEFLAGANEQVLLGGYTLSSPAVVETLSEQVERGVDVDVLVDGSPVGGMTGPEAAALDSLDRAGATVRVVAGQYARYRYHHAKYAVVDGREALVTTENWKPSGTGGKASRGWAVITGQDAVVSALRETYREDTGWVDAIPWADHDPTLVDDDRATGGHPQTFEAESLRVDETTLLAAPDNAEAEIVAAIESAEESLDIKQVRIGDTDFPFLQAVIEAAERGVEVRVLLSSAWYTEAENRQLERWLSDQADAAGLPISVRLAEPGGAFEKIHAKGLVIDGERVLVGSINWNNNSVRNNREIALLLDGEDVGEYFTAVFEADWEGETDEEFALPLGVALAVVGGVVLAILGATHVRFDAGSQRS